MKIYYTWNRSEPDTINGEKLTITITYCGFDKNEIDEIEKKLPKGMVFMDTNKKNSDQM